MATIRRFFATPNCPRFALLAEPELHARDGCGALEIEQDGYEPPQCNEPIAAERRGYNLMFLPQLGFIRDVRAACARFSLQSKARLSG